MMIQNKRFESLQRRDKHLTGSTFLFLSGTICGCLLAILLVSMQDVRVNHRLLLVEANKSSHETLFETKTLVVYSGPLHLPRASFDEYDEQDQMDKLYQANLDFFLIYGIDCHHQNTLLVVGPDVADHYQSRIDTMNQNCEAYGHFIQLVKRHPDCYDMESMRLVLHEGVVDLDNYDYLIHVSCVMTGPAPPNTYTPFPWTTELTRHLNNKVKMVGLSSVCHGSHTHIQPMVYALDRTGIDLIQHSDAVFDCQTVKEEENGESRYDKLSLVIGRYEIGMSQIIIEAGYKIHSILGDATYDKVSQETCKDHSDDIWLTSRLKAIYGHMPTLEEIFFFKTSRYLPAAIKKQIGYQGVSDWEWN